MAVHFLPRFAVAHGTQRFPAEPKRAALVIVFPSVLAHFQRPIFALLHDQSFVMPGLFNLWAARRGRRGGPVVRSGGIAYYRARSPREGS